jgi:hypothetical protein
VSTAADRSETPTHVCLITFQNLPFAPLAVGASVQKTLNDLTETGRLLEFFYLQDQGGESFAAELPDEADIFVESDIEAAAAELRNFLSGAESASDVSPPSWIHVPLGIDLDDEDALSPLLAELRQVRSIDNAIVILTAVEGTCPVNLTPFESLLWESEIRVPCWVFDGNVAQGRHQAIVGSQQLLQCVGGTQPAFDLRKLLSRDELESDKLSLPARVSEDAEAQSDEQNDDLLVLQTDLAMAVRNSRFLFVQHLADADDDQAIGIDPPSALDVKPEDVWNVNDVRAEFLADSEALQDVLLRVQSRR